MMDMGRLRQLPFSQILRERSIFEIFDQEFQKGTWLEISAIVGSDSSIEDCYRDGTIPDVILDRIVERLEELEKSSGSVQQSNDQR